MSFPKIVLSIIGLLLITSACFSQESIKELPRADKNQEIYDDSHWKSENIEVFKSTKDKLNVKYDDHKMWLTTPEDGTSLWPITDKHVGPEDKNIMYLYPKVTRNYEEIAWICVVYEEDNRKSGTEESIVIFYKDGIVHWWDIKA